LNTSGRRSPLFHLSSRRAAAYSGGLPAAVDLRRRLRGVTDNYTALADVRTIAGWQAAAEAGVAAAAELARSAEGIPHLTR
jgi:hypothetical protein